MPITDWPADDKPHTKLLQKGPAALTDAELIALFLKSGTRGKTALDLAKELLQEFGGLKKLLRTSSALLMKKKGMGSMKYATLKAAIEIGRRYMHDNIAIGEVLNNSRTTQSFLADRLRDQVNEVFACVFLDTRYRLIAYEELFQGTINEANIYPREIVRRGLAHNAAKIILAHNHPSGHAIPSAADKEVTQLIKEALALVDIDVADHIIIGNPDIFSFADTGLI